MVGNAVRRPGLLSCVFTAFMMLGASPLFAQSLAVGTVAKRAMTQRLVTVHVNDATLKSVLQQIAQQAGLTPFYSAAVVNSPIRMNINMENVPVEEAFARVLRGTGLKANIEANGVAFGVSEGPVAYGQGTIVGTVIDAKTRQPLRGATVMVSGTSADGDASRSALPSVITNTKGEFRLPNIAQGTVTIQVRLLGYVKATKTVSVTEGQTAHVEIALEASVNALDQVVVTGTVAATAQREVPNAMTIITAKDIEQRGITQIQQLFRGDVPGLFAANQGSNNVLDGVLMFSRGATSLSNAGDGVVNGTNPIKTYVDGVELADPQYISQIDPQSIERIEILTGPQASSIYGSNAINGVMQIFTKRGTAGARPQTTINLSSGFAENNYSNALAPDHTADLRLSGMQGRWSYNGGGSVQYVGAWTPGKQTVRYAGDGGARADFGIFVTDVSVRRGLTRNIMRGDTDQERGARQVTGKWKGNPSDGMVPYDKVATLDGSTYGLTIGVRPLSQWSHEIVLGTDVSNTGSYDRTARFAWVSDSSLYYSQSLLSRTSERYSTTLQVHPWRDVAVTMSGGMDHWRTTSSRVSGGGTKLTGQLGDITVTRDPSSKNTGGFFQGQLGLWDAVFVTYGLRAEWNPSYGADQVPNVTPRYGIALTRAVGDLTAKLRASYGRATRPPGRGQKEGVWTSDPLYSWLVPAYGVFEYIRANPQLGPEFQQGGEGGLELYIGNRVSFVVTRYNQTVDDLTAVVPVDSQPSLVPDPYGRCSTRPNECGYVYTAIYRWLNLASIRNQGWELQGRFNMGPVSTSGTYSWTKSRVLGVTEQYRAELAGDPIYTPGAPFNFMPEHTWALTTAYSGRMTTISLTTNGISQIYMQSSSFSRDISTNSLYRIRTYQSRITPYGSFFKAMGKGYVTADLNASRRFSTWLDATLQVHNLSDYYQNDYNFGYATVGRQTKLGVRMRFQ